MLAEIMESPLGDRVDALPAQPLPLRMSVDLDDSQPWASVFGMVIKHVGIPDWSVIVAGSSDQHVSCWVGQRHGQVSLQHGQVVRANLARTSLRSLQAIGVRQPNREDVRKILPLDLAENEIRRDEANACHAAMIDHPVTVVLLRRDPGASNRAPGASTKQRLASRP